VTTLLAAAAEGEQSKHSKYLPTEGECHFEAPPNTTTFMMGHLLSGTTTTNRGPIHGKAAVSSLLPSCNPHGFKNPTSFRFIRRLFFRWKRGKFSRFFVFLFLFLFFTVVHPEITVLTKS
jgi:hypothetical protein